MTTSEPWSFDGDQGRLVRTAHYRLFLTGDDALMTAILPGFLERSLNRYTTELATLPKPTVKLDTFVMRDRKQWTSLMRRQLGPAAETYLVIARGGFTSGGRGLLWNVGLRDTLALAGHEGWHQYTQRVFRESLPPWLEESVAVYYEGFVLDPLANSGDVLRPSPWANVARFDELRRAAHRLLPLPTLLTTEPDALLARDDDALGYYAQLWALSLFLTQTTDARRAGLATVLRDAGDGQLSMNIAARLGQSNTPSPLALWRAYFMSGSMDDSGDPLTRDAAEFASFTADLLSTGAREAIAQGRDPRSAE